MTNTSALGLLVASSVTASAFYGDASHLSNIPTGGAVTNTTTFQSSVTVKSSMTVIDSAAGDTYALIVATGTAASQQIVTVSTTGAVILSTGSSLSSWGSVYIGSGSTSNVAGAWTAYTPTFTGFSVLPTGYTYRYIKIGKFCTVSYVGDNALGTSNATTFTIGLPFASAFPIYGVPVLVVDNNSNFTGTLYAAGSASAVQVFKGIFGAFTSSGGKDAIFTFTYETQ
jgi:hypothetical protein